MRKLKKMEFSTISVKGPKDQNSDKKCQEVTLNSTLCQEMPPKTEKSRHYSLSQQNSVEFCKDFTRDRIFLHQHCWHIGTILHLWPRVIGGEIVVWD